MSDNRSEHKKPGPKAKSESGASTKQVLARTAFQRTRHEGGGIPPKVTENSAMDELQGLGTLYDKNDLPFFDQLGITHDQLIKYVKKFQYGTALVKRMVEQGRLNKGKIIRLEDEE